MPLIKIELKKGKSLAFLKELMNCVFISVRDALHLPEYDCNMRISEYDPELFVMKSPYQILVEISMFSGRSPMTKKSLYSKITNDLQDKLKINKEEVFILLIEQPKENWGIRGGISASETDLEFEVEI